MGRSTAADSLTTSTAPRLRCALLWELADTDGLIARLGEAVAAELLRRCDSLSRELIGRHGGRAIDKTEGLLVLFERPIEAVAFALELQRALPALAAAERLSLSARVGIHVGELLCWENSAKDVREGAKPIEVEGLAKAVTARLMHLALPGQILLSEATHSLALRARVELPSDLRVEWRRHGRYRLQGLATPMVVFEVGEIRVAPLQPPPSHRKARRLLSWWQWRPLYAALAVATVLASVYPWLQPPPAIAFAERDWLLLADLRNLTGERRLDLALDSAIRVALEQSQRINLVPQLKARSALAQMRRPPNTVLDRELASQLAQRLGARAVLLPSVAESAGRLRVSAELVDPKSGVTVYSRSHEVSAEQRLIPALDAVLREVRSDLGESLQEIESSSQPLAEVTTHSIDALRLYSLAHVAKAEQRYADSEVLLDRALEIDPEFAMALVAKSVLAYLSQRYETYDQLRRQAGQWVSRLSMRERLMLRANLAIGGPGEPLLSAWQAFVDFYPDDARARYNLAYFAIEADNDCPRALKVLDSSQPTIDPFLAQTRYEVARCQLMLNRLQDALHTFNEARQLGLFGNGPEYAQALAAAGDRAAALRALDTRDQDRSVAEREMAEQVRVQLQVERADWKAAAAALHRWREWIAATALESSELHEVAALTLAAYLNQAGWKSWSERLIEQAVQATAASPLTAQRRTAAGVAAAWLRVRWDPDLPIEQLAPLFEVVRARGQTRLNELLAITEAEHLLQRGAHDQALARLPAVESPTTAFAAASLRFRIALGRDDPVSAVKGCRWLRQQHGRAMAERIAAGGLQIANLIERQLAPLSLRQRHPQGAAECPPDADWETVDVAMLAAASERQD